MKHFAAIAIASLAAFAWASPVETDDRPGPDVCDQDPIDELVDYLSENNVRAAASAYCSSVLGPGAGNGATVTKTSTSTIKHTVSATVKTTVTVTSTKTAAAGASTVTVTVYSNCAIEGYAKEAAYHADTAAGVDNFVTCSAECQADSGCVSFAFGSGQCLLFNVTSVSNVNVASTSPFAFFDRNCPISSASSPPDRLRVRQIVIPGIISIGPAPPAAAPTISISDPTIASEACSCFLPNGGGGPTKTVTTVQTVTSDVGATITQGSTITKVVTVGGTVTGYQTVTVTTTA